MELNKRAKVFCWVWIVVLTVLFPVYFTVGIVSIVVSWILDKIYGFCNWVNGLRWDLIVLRKNRFKY
jgi:hypothetical protein